MYFYKHFKNICLIFRVLIVLMVFIKTSLMTTIHVCSEEKTTTKQPINSRDAYDDVFDYSYDEFAENTTPKPRESTCTLKNFNDSRDAIFFSKNNYITKLSADNCQLSIMPIGMFDSLSALNHVALESTGIMSIYHVTDFYGADNLIFLNLSHNRIQVLEDSPFDGAPLLATIDLSFNRILEISSNAFESVKSLQVLLLNNNQLETFSCALSDTIQVLRLDHNPLRTIVSAVLSPSTTLKEISLSSTLLTHLLTDAPGINWSRIRSLNISNNTHLQEIDFHLNSTQHLDMDNTFANSCRITKELLSLTASYNHITAVRVDDPENSIIETISLSHNRLTSISNLTQLTTVIGLDVSFNAITNFDINTFANMRNLKVLMLQNCGLKQITYGLFTQQTHLRWLDISLNQLAEIDLDMLHSNSELTKLFINGNNLTTFQHERVRNILPMIEAIDLSDNHFECSYLAVILRNLQWNLVRFINESSSRVTNSTNIKGIACYNKKPDFTNVSSLTPPQSNEVDYNQSFAHIDRRIGKVLEIVKEFSSTPSISIKKKQIDMDLSGIRQHVLEMNSSLNVRMSRQQSDIMLNVTRRLAKDGHRSDRYLRFKKLVEANDRDSFYGFVKVMKHLVKVSELLASRGDTVSEVNAQNEVSNVDYNHLIVVMTVAMICVIAIMLWVAFAIYTQNRYFCQCRTGSAEESLNAISITNLT